MRKLLPVLLSLFLGACVSQGTHDKLQADRDALKAQLDEKTKQSAQTEATLKAALEEEKRNSAELKSRIESLEADIAGMVSDKSSLQASVAQMKTALSELQRRKEEADARIAEYRNVMAKFKGLIDAGKLKVRIVDGRMVVVLATDVLFASGSASLNKEGRANVSEVAKLLATIPKRNFQIEGHTDNVPISTAQYRSNWELAASRALTVLKTMLDAGMPPERISAASFGESKPVAPNVTADGRASNRRIDIIILPDLSSLPGFEELNRMEKSS
jgi:chemotaxis protein MotB